MKSLKNSFAKFDEFIFKQIDSFKSSDIFTQINNSLESLDDNQQRLISQIASLVLVFIPILIALVFFFSNAGKRAELAQKEDILKMIKSINFKRSQIQSMGSQLISGAAIVDQSDLNSKLQNFASVSNISAQAIRVEEFDSFPLSASLVKTTAIIKFSSLSTSSLFNFVDRILKGANYKIDNFNITKNVNENKLFGSFKIYQFGKK